MLKSIFAAAILLMAGSAIAAPYLNAQFGNPEGFSQGGGKPQCSSPAALPYGQCVAVANVTGFAGTFTVKRPSIEVLLQLYCGTLTGARTLVWAGERFVGTSDISVSGLPPITGYCWFNWQAINNTGAVMDGGDFEYQLVFH